MPKAQSQIGLLTQGAHPRKRKPGQLGRTTALTPEVSKKICDAIRAGNFLSVAARFAGVSEYTVLDWVKRGRGEHPSRSASKVYVDFVHDLDMAEAAAEVQANIHWRAAMPKDWKASQRWLEVRYPERYAPQQTTPNIAGAFAGINVNIESSGRVSAGNDAPAATNAPLAALLEANPSLIAPTMAVLDALLPTEAGNGQKDHVEAEIDPETAVEGSFVELDAVSKPESDEMGG